MMVKWREYLTYRGGASQWAWIFHRVTGVGVFLFLLVHIIDTAFIGWGPELYNKAMALYRMPFFRVGEVVLAGMVLYHALNGVRIMIIDFWPSASVHHVRLFWGTMLLFAASMAPITWLMGRRILEDLFG